MRALHFPEAYKPTSKALSRFIAAGSVAMLVVGLGLLYLLAEASSNRALFERNYARLFVANVVVAAAIFLAVAWVAWRLLQRIRAGRFGSRLLLKLAVTFALVGFAPGLLIYGVSYQFVSRSIESWFDAKVQSALDAGLSLGRVSLDAIASDLVRKSRNAADQLAQSSGIANDLQLGKIAELLGADEVTLWSSSGQMLASAGVLQLRLTPAPPNAAQIRQARNERVTSWFEGLDESAMRGTAPQVKVLAQVDSSSIGLGSEARYLLVAHPLPTTLVSNAVAVEEVSREYQERALSLAGLKRMYIGTLTLGLFLAVFGALLLALALGNQIAQPLLLLAEGVEQVAAGDLTPKLVWAGKDELGGLTRAFAGMTQQLHDARQEVQSSLVEIDAARRQVQTILDNLTTGVLVMQASGVLITANPGAAKLLGKDPAQLIGRCFYDIQGVGELTTAVQQQFQSMPESAETVAAYWQQTIELGSSEASERGSPFAKTKTLVVRGAQMPNHAQLLVFDDITDVVSAQRAQAWGEVARRLAHEIKNPLTPIQLSAERLERRILPKLDVTEAAVLAKSVKVIVDQVDAMKRLVNEFRDFARLPNAELKPLNLNDIVLAVTGLYEADLAQKIECALQSDCPVIAGDGEQLRQVLHNLLQNAMDAQEENGARGARVRVATQWMPNTKKVKLLVQDQGPGFPEHILRRAFEPYVTTKQKGTGLGLAVVKKIADDHHARIELTNRMQNGAIIGAQVSLSFNAIVGDGRTGIERGTA